MSSLLKGYRINKKGELVKDQRRLDASAKIRQQKSKKQMAVSPAKAGLRR